MGNIRYSICPILRNDNIRKDGKAPINYRIILNAVMIKIPTGKFIEQTFWDKTTKKVLKQHPLANELNSIIAIRMEEFNKFMLKQEILGKEINRELIKSFFNGQININFYQFWEQQIKAWSSFKKAGTLKSYRSCLNSLKEFKSVVYFNDLNLQFIEELNSYFKNTRKNSDGGAASSHKWTNSMIKCAIKKGYLEKNPYSDFIVKHSNVEREHLTIEEVKLLTQLDFATKNQSLDKIRDVFVFACYTGLRYSDIEGLCWENIGEDSIRLRMVKTDKDVQIPLIPQSKKIIEKYKQLDTIEPLGKVFRTITNQKTNTSLKRLMTVAGIDKSISFHCARHTFACIHVNAGTHMLNLKNLLGHSSIQQTEIYAKSQTEDLVKAMNNLSML